ncbi:MAG: ABC transporter permease [Candidatus Taylorbacteria bacterium]|nr:ABC transporter permease [Candidatus Taylorbacteria bacterium]
MYNKPVMETNRKPTRTIEPRDHLSIFSTIYEIWQFRELLILLAWRDYKVRYRQTAIGILWAILHFGRFPGIKEAGIPYALFVYSGIIIWQFFSNAISESSLSLVANSQMITKIYFPRIIIPFAKIITQFINLFFSGIVLFGLMLYFHVIPSLSLIYYSIPIFLLLLLSSSSIGIILSAINVKYRDVSHILPYFIQLGLFASPVIYSATTLGRYHWLIYLNPATGIIDAFRSALFSLPFPGNSFTISCAITLILLVFGLYYFSKAEGDFSDVI